MGYSGVGTLSALNRLAGDFYYKQKGKKRKENNGEKYDS